MILISNKYITTFKSLLFLGILFLSVLSCENSSNKEKNKTQNPIKINEEKLKKIKAIPKDNPKSPILFTIIAFIADLLA